SLCRRLLAQSRILATAAGLAGRLRLAQLHPFRPLERLARCLGRARHVRLLGVLGLAVIIGQRRGPAAFALIALRPGGCQLGLRLQPMIVVAGFGTALLLPDLIGALADPIHLLLRPGLVGHRRSPHPGMHGLCRALERIARPGWWSSDRDLAGL